MYGGIPSTIVNTHLIRLRRILPEARFEIVAKFEALNPGGVSCWSSYWGGSGSGGCGSLIFEHADLFPLLHRILSAL